MLLKNLHVRESRLFTYTIASSDKWFSAVNERTLYLRNDPDFGPVMRGEICELGPDCHADLGQVLLEYALSCEGCQDPNKADELVECVGERLGRILATKLYQDSPDLSVMDQVCGAFEFVLQSMNLPAQSEKTANYIRYDLVCCPLVETARKTGLMRGIVPARRGFIAILVSMLNSLAPQWTMVHPLASQAHAPLTEIILHY